MSLQDPGRRPSLLIEGWRGINHSYALVNQYQMRELLRQDRFNLFAKDLPFVNAQWNRTQNGSDFPAADQRLIDEVPPPGDRVTDFVYRIAAPCRGGDRDDARATMTFMAAEIGLPLSNFALGTDGFSFFCRDRNLIVTPSAWSRDRIVEFGFPAEKVAVVPHAADPALFAPMSAEDRASRRALLGLAADETVFVNVGGAFWNKGLDLVLIAFAHLRQSQKRIRLILKDQRDLYGRTVETVVEEVARSGRCHLDADTIAAISVIPGHLTRLQLRDLYNVADCYVSPYRAEGFNLPVLEAIACHTPIIVTAGGATDDFCPDGLALKIPGRPAIVEGFDSNAPGRYIEPDIESLVEAMRAVCAGPILLSAPQQKLRAAILQRFSWAEAAAQIADLLIDGHVIPADARPAPPITTQSDIRALITAMRPRRMAHIQKTRIGNDYDGGYVLPAIAAQADLVVSIGVGHDVSFDYAMAQRGAIVLQFDHTVETPPAQHENFRFYKKGLAADRAADFLTFGDILDLMQNFPGQAPLLKFDIEGSEYDAFTATDPAQFSLFPVIVCEIHDLDRLGEPLFFRRVAGFLDLFTAGHVPVHIHANNYGGVGLVHGVPLPKVLELSFLRRDLDACADFADDPIPGPLDRPNHPYLADLCLNAFG
jgi:glycosyltransferase involved in cell wall biosynthesis